jgi:hypothetical protein
MGQALLSRAVIAATLQGRPDGSETDADEPDERHPKKANVLRHRGSSPRGRAPT